MISQRGMAAALGRAASGSSLPRFVRGKAIQPYVGAELAEKLSNPLIFQWSAVGPNAPPAIVYGYDVTILIDVCKAVIAAAAAGKATRRQAATVDQARVILRPRSRGDDEGRLALPSRAPALLRLGLRLRPVLTSCAMRPHASVLPCGESEHA